MTPKRSDCAAARPRRRHLSRSWEVVWPACRNGLKLAAFLGKSRNDVILFRSVSRLTLFEGAPVTVFDGRVGSECAADCVPGAFVLAAVFARAEGWVHEYPDGEPAPCSSVRIASPTTRSGGAFPRPDCAQAWRRARGRQGQALRARLRASLTAPARDASSAAQAGTRKRPPSRTRKQANPDSRGPIEPGEASGG